MNHSDLIKKVIARESKRSIFVSEVLFQINNNPEQLFSFLVEKQSDVKSVDYERIEIIKDFLKNNFKCPISEIYPEKSNNLLIYKDEEFQTRVTTGPEKTLFIKSIKNRKLEGLQLLEEDSKSFEILDKYFSTNPESKEYYKKVKELVLEKMAKDESRFNRWFLGLHSNVRTFARNMYVRQLQIQSNNSNYLSELDLIVYQNRLEKVFFEKNSELLKFLVKSGYSIKLENFNKTKEELMGGI